MIGRSILLALAALGAMAAAAPGQADTGRSAGVYDADQAHIDYMLKCQGCHRPDGSGDDHSNPPLRAMVARFLTVPGGRAFLGKVPGVATTNLDDQRLANLLNWTLHRFDPDHIPASFHPYTPQELKDLRQNPLRLERATTRARLVAGFVPAPAR